MISSISRLWTVPRKTAAIQVTGDENQIFSTTNIQESGVEEADIIKTDEYILYMISERSTDVLPVDGLYLVTDRGLDRPDLLITIGGQATDYGRCWYNPWRWNKGRTEVTLNDVTDPSAPVHVTRPPSPGRTIYFVKKYNYFAPKSSISHSNFPSGDTP